MSVVSQQKLGRPATKIVTQKGARFVVALVASLLVWGYRQPGGEAACFVVGHCQPAHSP